VSSPILKRLGHFLCLVSLLGLLDVHLLVMQGVAWGQMAAAARAEESSETKSTLAESLSEGFAGTSPCSLCHKILETSSDERNRENGGEGTVSASSLVLGLLERHGPQLTPPRSQMTPVDWRSSVGAGRSDDRVSPPPRGPRLFHSA
jgi:hypothetical protein